MCIRDRLYTEWDMWHPCDEPHALCCDRERGLQFHELVGTGEEAFQKLNRAYEVLKDEKSRAAYDRFGFDLGDDTSADDLAQEIGTHANRAVGVAAIRTAVAMVICCALRRRWLRAAAIGACGVSALAGRLRGDAKLEKIGFRVVVVPVSENLVRST